MPTYGTKIICSSQYLFRYHSSRKIRFSYISSAEDQGCGVDRVFSRVDSDTEVGVLMSTPTPTPTPGPTPDCLECIALCKVQSLCRNIPMQGTSLWVRWSYKLEAALWLGCFSGIKSTIHTDDQMQDSSLDLATIINRNAIWVTLLGESGVWRLTGRPRVGKKGTS